MVPKNERKYKLLPISANHVVIFMYIKHKGDIYYNLKCNYKS
jgi:hypothetical protein